jgi:hypothetical protein
LVRHIIGKTQTQDAEDNIWKQKKDKVVGGSRRCIMRNFKIRKSPQILLEDQTRRKTWAEHVALVGEKRNKYTFSV